MNILLNVISLGLLLIADGSANSCGGKPADVFFLLDSSSSIWGVDYRKQVQFVKDVIGMFDIGANRTRVGVAAFSTHYHPIINLGDHDDKDNLMAAVDKTPFFRGDTHTGRALENMRVRGFAEARRDVAHVGIVLTDGESFSREKTIYEAELTKKDGIYMFAIGIGYRYILEELVEIGSKPTKDFVFTVNSYDALKTIKDILAIRTCEVPTTTTTGPPPPPLQDQPTCGRTNKADIIFALDSAELGTKKTQTIYQFISGVSNEFNMKEGNIRAGIVSHNCPKDGDIRLNEHSDKQTFSASVENAEFPNLSRVLRRVRTQSFTEKYGGRPEAKRIAVLFIDGPLDKKGRIYREARRTRGNDVELFVVAIGDEVNMKEALELCSNPPEDHLLIVKSYESLPDSMDRFWDSICKGL